MKLVGWNGPIADILSNVVFTQTIHPILIRLCATPSATFNRGEGTNHIQVRQVREGVLALHTRGVLEENQLLAVCAVKDLHWSSSTLFLEHRRGVNSRQVGRRAIVAISV